MAPGRQVQRSPRRVHQQDGPRRRRLRAGGRRDPGAAQGHPAAAPASDRRRGEIPGRDRSDRGARAGLGQRHARRRLHGRPDSRRAARAGCGLSRKNDRDAGRSRRAADGNVPRGQAPRAGSDQADHPGRRAQAEAGARAARQRVPEQGRAADAGRGGRLPALARGRAAGGGQGRRQDRRAMAARRRAVFRARFQDHDRSLLRHFDLYPGLLGQARKRRLGAEFHPQQTRADRAAGQDAREQARGDFGGDGR